MGMLEQGPAGIAAADSSVNIRWESSALAAGKATHGSLPFPATGSGICHQFPG